MGRRVGEALRLGGVGAGAAWRRGSWLSVMLSSVSPVQASRAVEHRRRRSRVGDDTGDPVVGVAREGLDHPVAESQAGDAAIGRPADRRGHGLARRGRRLLRIDLGDAPEDVAGEADGPTRGVSDGRDIAGEVIGIGAGESGRRRKGSGRVGQIALVVEDAGIGDWQVGDARDRAARIGALRDGAAPIADIDPGSLVGRGFLDDAAETVAHVVGGDRARVFIGGDRVDAVAGEIDRVALLVDRLDQPVERVETVGAIKEEITGASTYRGACRQNPNLCNVYCIHSGIVKSISVIVLALAT